MASHRTLENPLIKLAIEGNEGSFWGQVKYEDNLIIDEADSIESLQNKMERLLLDFHELNPGSYEFEIEAA